MKQTLGENQLKWCREHLIKDGVPIFSLYEKTRYEPLKRSNCDEKLVSTNVSNRS